MDNFKELWQNYIVGICSGAVGGIAVFIASQGGIPRATLFLFLILVAFVFLIVYILFGRSEKKHGRIIIISTLILFILLFFIMMILSKLGWI